MIYIYICQAPPLRSTFDALLETYMVKLSAHFNKGCSKFTRYGQAHCTLQLSVQWDSPDMIKLTAHFKLSVQWAWSLEILWADVDLLLMPYMVTRHDQTHCTLQLSVQCTDFARHDQTHLHTSVKFAVTLLTWNFVSRCGQMFLEYRSACVYGNIRLWCKELVWEEMHFKWNDQLYMLHAKVGSCWKDPTGHVHMEVDSFDASKQREDRNLLQVELARIHTADTQPVLPHCRSCSSKAI